MAKNSRQSRKRNSNSRFNDTKETIEEYRVFFLSSVSINNLTKLSKKMSKLKPAKDFPWFLFKKSSGESNANLITRVVKTIQTSRLYYATSFLIQYQEIEDMRNHIVIRIWSPLVKASLKNLKNVWPFPWKESFLPFGQYLYVMSSEIAKIWLPFVLFLWATR